eukprot:SAG25_NODE_1178_length_3685_cov_114.934746_4_plen_173_part_00
MGKTLSLSGHVRPQALKLSPVRRQNRDFVPYVWRPIFRATEVAVAVHAGVCAQLSNVDAATGDAYCSWTVRKPAGDKLSFQRKQLDAVVLPITHEQLVEIRMDSDTMGKIELPVRRARTPPTSDERSFGCQVVYMRVSVAVGDEEVAGHRMDSDIRGKVEQPSRVRRTRMVQ